MCVDLLLTAVPTIQSVGISTVLRHGLSYVTVDKGLINFLHKTDNAVQPVCCEIKVMVVGA